MRGSQVNLNRRRRPRPAGLCLSASRRGAVAVEFAAVAPILLAVVIGMLELSRVYSMQNTLETAAREGARFASLDRTGMMLNGQTANQKLVSDVKKFLGSIGLAAGDITVSVVHADNPATLFDLDDPDNDLELFQIRISVPYNKVSFSPVKHYTGYTLSAALTFRNGRATVAN